MRVTDIAPVAIIFVTAGIALGIGAEVLDTIKGSVTENSTAYTSVINASIGIGQVAKWMPTIGLVIAAAIVIGVVASSFGSRMR